MRRRRQHDRQQRQGRCASHGTQFHGQPSFGTNRGPPRNATGDDNGAQPLVALWRVADLRRGLASAIASGDYAVQALQARLQMRLVRLPGVRLGNLNTPADLAAAGIDHP